MRAAILLSGASVVATAFAQQSAYGQCTWWKDISDAVSAADHEIGGGTGWTGATTCVSGYTCTFNNQYYSQCVPSTAGSGSTTTKATPTTLQTVTTTQSSSSGATSAHFKWFGVDESGAEFGNQDLPGVWGTDFIFPDNSSLDTLMSQGFNIFRVPFQMERMVPNELTGPVWQAYLANYTGTINHITAKGGYAVVDPHNFGRYYGNIITDVAGFQAFWTTVASAFKNNELAIFDTNNEYHDMNETLVLNLNQAAINGIRAAGATSQYIFAEGNSYSAAMYWNTSSDNLKTLTDPENKLIYEMHQYLDSDNSGTSATCVSGTIGVERVEGATAWLRSNGKLGIIGEYAGGANSVCQEAITGMLNHLKTNDDVWMGAIWWGGGPWWGDYIYSFEPPSGTGYTYYDSILLGLR